MLENFLVCFRSFSSHRHFFAHFFLTKIYHVLRVGPSAVIVFLVCTSSSCDEEVDCVEWTKRKKWTRPTDLVEREKEDVRRGERVAQFSPLDGLLSLAGALCRQQPLSKPGFCVPASAWTSFSRHPASVLVGHAVLLFLKTFVCVRLFCARKCPTTESSLDRIFFFLTMPSALSRSYSVPVGLIQQPVSRGR